VIHLQWKLGVIHQCAKHGDFATEEAALLHVQKLLLRAGASGEEWMQEPGSTERYELILYTGPDGAEQPIARLSME
jgi:hypothetical protein